MEVILHSTDYLVKSQLMELSDELVKFQNHFQSLGMNELFVLGGAARSILDAFYYNENISVRDLDIAFVIGHEANEAEIWKIIEDVEIHGLGKNISPALRKKDWLHPKEPNSVLRNRNYGYGFHLRTQNIPIISLSFYFSHYALESVGYFTFDTTMIRLPANCSLIDTLADEDCIIDPHNGYDCWRMRQPIFLKVEDLMRDAIKASFRIIRSYAKLNSLSIPNELINKMKIEVTHTFQKGNFLNQFEFVRSILKILNDQNYLWEIEQISKIGVLDIFPDVRSKLENGSFKSWVREIYPFLDINNP